MRTSAAAAAHGAAAAAAYPTTPAELRRLGRV
eukprot:COSAG02_NODE_44880_length_362_cov_0.779468_1_plen_31_part_10